jgi:uncharacterized protein with FMN-binding domain
LVGDPVKRIVLWVMSTLTALILLFGYHTSTSSQAAAGGKSSAVAPVQGSSGTGSTGTPSDSTASGSATSTSAASTTVTGDEASTRWGPVQVELTVADGTITDVSVVQYPDNNGKDQQINARALPVLIQETLDAQNDSIDMVSGATVTSEGYLESLQSALDKAGM